MPATAEPAPVLPGLSPICGRPIEARFDAALTSSDGGLLVLRESETLGRCARAGDIWRSTSTGGGWRFTQP
jgi:hypothetical protein